MVVVLGGPGKRCVVLMNQSSRDYTLLDVRPSPGPDRGAVSPQSSRDKRPKHSLPGSTVRSEGRAISVGDRVQAQVDRTIRVDGGQHVANRAVYTVLGLDPDGALRVRGADGGIAHLPRRYVDE